MKRLAAKCIAIYWLNSQFLLEFSDSCTLFYNDFIFNWFLFCWNWKI